MPASYSQPFFLPGRGLLDEPDLNHWIRDYHQALIVFVACGRIVQLCELSGFPHPPNPWPLNSQKDGAPQAPSLVTRAGDEAMATAAEYRKLAEECFEWAREARDGGVREHYAKLGQIWLDSAVRAQLRSAVLTPREPAAAQKVASRAA